MVDYDAVRRLKKHKKFVRETKNNLAHFLDVCIERKAYGIAVRSLNQHPNYERAEEYWGKLEELGIKRHSE